MDKKQQPTSVSRDYLRAKSERDLAEMEASINKTKPSKAEPNIIKITDRLGGGSKY